MAKRKKYPKLPNGYGSIKYLGKGRRNAYAVHPPTTEFTPDGIPITPKAICYVDDWMKGFAILTAYKAGTYYKGMEKEIQIDMKDKSSDLVQTLLADYNRLKGVESEEISKPTFKDVFEAFYEHKYEKDKSRTYSESSKTATRSSFKHCSAIHDRIFADLRHKDLQGVVDNCNRKHATLEFIVTTIHQMYRYALAYELVDRDYSAAVKINVPDNEEHGIPFSDEELRILWENQDNPVVEFMLIMIYSGYRITAYTTLEVNLEQGYFNGGIKTKTSKERTVPIHSGIRSLVEKRLKRDGKLMPITTAKWRQQMYAVQEELGIQRHTPHDCRHTFSMLCEKYRVNENDRKRMMGHSFGNDITNAVYGHRELEDLRTEIEKIQICY